MMNTSKSQACKLVAGTIIHGKWHHKSYQIVKPLGYGATGYVYLAKGGQGLVALKISNDSYAITSEVNVLRRFAKVQGCLGPSLLDVDDWLRPGYLSAIPFYVMEYLQGTSFLSFIEKNGGEWIGVFALQLLSDLEKLHQEGWVFGDLKPDNLLVVGPPVRVRWLDVGGTTLMGRSIKEFTEFYDRGYWGLGSRKAEPSYDLFALAMILINSQFPARFSRKNEGENHLPQLVNAIRSKPILRKYKKVLIRAIQGRYRSAREMRIELIRAMSEHEDERQQQPKQPPQATRPMQQTAKNIRVIKKKKRSQNKYRGVIETIVIAFFLFIAYFLYIAGQMM